MNICFVSMKPLAMHGEILKHLSLESNNSPFVSLQECSSDIADSVPEIQEAFQCANDLISDKSVDPRERESIKKERNEIGEGFKSLKLELNDYEKE